MSVWFQVVKSHKFISREEWTNENIEMKICLAVSAYPQIMDGFTHINMNDNGIHVHRIIVWFLSRMLLIPLEKHFMSNLSQIFMQQIIYLSRNWYTC